MYSSTVGHVYCISKEPDGGGGGGISEWVFVAFSIGGQRCGININEPRDPETNIERQSKLLLWSNIRIKQIYKQLAAYLLDWFYEQIISDYSL